MTDQELTDDDVLGPIDFVIIEFSGGKLAGETAAALVDLIESGTIRLFDLHVVAKAADGTVTDIDLAEVGDGTLGGFVALDGATSGLLGDSDIALAVEAMNPDTVAALLVYENRWAERFVAAARREGGQLIASTRVSAQDLIDALDALDAS